MPPRSIDRTFTVKTRPIAAHGRRQSRSFVEVLVGAAQIRQAT
jgi:hypothetical protein